MTKTITSLFVLVISQILLVQCTPQNRILTIINDCDFTVWYGFVAGAVPNTQGCAPCPLGSSCKNNECFWNLPTPSMGNYKLAAGTNGTATVPFNSNSRPEVWSGVIAGRTGCVDGNRCETGDCGSTNHDTDPCTTGFSQPATQAEVTFLKTAQDTYDVEIINGINIPVEMSADVSGSFYGYDCGNPGATTPANPGLGKCTWDFKVPNLYYYWVKAGGPTCASQADCDSNNQTQPGSVCGLNAEGQNTQLTCGKLLGIYTADQVCGINKNFGSPFDCGSNTDLYGCIGAYKDSCYTNGATSGCCGCVDWATTGLQLPNDTTLCKASTSKWLSDSLPKLSWMKNGCPTAYTYPFDDPSSTFTCRDFDSGGDNNANYRITFCPGKSSVNVTIGANTGNSPASSLRPFN